MYIKYESNCLSFLHDNRYGTQVGHAPSSQTVKESVKNGSSQFCQGIYRTGNMPQIQIKTYNTFILVLIHFHKLCLKIITQEHHLC